MPEKENKQENEPQKPSGSRLNSESLIPDILALGCIVTGLLLWVGFTGKTDGRFILRMRNFFDDWIGTGRIIFVVLFLGLGTGIFLSRYTTVKIRIPLKKIGLIILLFFLLLALASSSDHFSGGKIGDTLFGQLTAVIGEIPATILLWGIIAVLFYFLFDLNRPLSESAVFIKKKVAHFCASKPIRSSDEVTLFRRRLMKENIEKEENDPLEKNITNHPIDSVIGGNEIKGKSKPRTNRLPPINLLEPEMGFLNKNIDVQSRIDEIESAMEEFGTPVKVIGYSIGPAIIQYQVVPGALEKNGSHGTVIPKKIRVAQVAQMERDLAVRMGVANLSIQAPVPGENFIGIDIPNPDSLKVRLRPLMESREFQSKTSPLNVALGRDISGKPVVVDLEQMPHLLIAGTTNSGKSILIRSMAVCLIMNNTPETLRLIMIDPKRVELFRFNGLPHLLGKVETEYDRSISVLGWAVQEMKNRYKLFETVGVRKLSLYNQYAVRNGQKPLPYIVIFIDELAEIVKGADKLGQEYIDTLASLARATGMHLVVATQRPDTTVITGKIKTNIPARIALNVASAIDSRVIMGKQGAEKLLGRGDMYFVDPSLNVPIRIQGPLLTDQEIDSVVALWKKLSPKPVEEAEAPWEEMIEDAEKEVNGKEEKDLKAAIRLVCRTRKASASYLQGKMNISFPKASRLLDRMEQIGVVGPIQVGGKAREVLWSEEEADSYGENAA
ncbi:MAG TPA: DNA translocase FtsK [Flexilinea sp.]|nr:DNA translocase FtsK [Flexilinea sp.]